MNQNYFRQVVDLDLSFNKCDRFNFFESFLKNKKVLHIGCVDYPITDVHNNLHLKLSKICNHIDGFDINIDEEISKIIHVSNGNLYSKFEDIKKNNYDYVIVPEVIEHVDNIKDFLQSIDQLNGDIIITAPDIFAFKKDQFVLIDDQFIEIIHPDHNCWFSPYTLKNVLIKYLKKKKIFKLYRIRGSVAAVLK